MSRTSLDEAIACDAADPLRGFAARFTLPAGILYLDGNSLGALPAATAGRIAQVVEQEWGTALVRSWNDAGWIKAPARIGAKIARLIGAGSSEVIVTDSTSVNLFKLLVAVSATISPGAAILCEAGDFPTDRHVAERAAATLGRPFRAVLRADLASAIGGGAGIAVLAHVHYRSGARHDIAELERIARASRCRIVWDLSHSTGAVPLDLARDGAMLAIGCGYKYLNGGPGAPAFLYAQQALHADLASPIAGWLGHARPFDFGETYVPAAGIARFQAGTPPMLSLLALEMGVDLALEADPGALWAKSCALFDLFADRVALLAPSLELVTPRDPASRGSHLAFAHPDAHAIIQALIARGVIGDFRAPDIARFGLTPLYTGYADVWRATAIIAEVMTSGAWRDPRFAVRATVT